MPLHRVVEEFSVLAPRCRTKEDLFALIQAAARDLGFDRFAMVQGLWFRYPDRRLIRMDNFGEYAETFIRRNYYLHDPALLACQRINTAFPWSMVRKLILFCKRQERIMHEAFRHGLKVGFTVPVSVPGEPAGCCSFVAGGSHLPSRWHCRAAALIGAEAFREARRLHGFPARAKRIPHLSRRKLEVVELAALGKTDPEIAAILGLQPSTIETYMAQLRQAFDVYSRSQLVAQALRFGFIAFQDAMSGF